MVVTSEPHKIMLLKVGPDSYRARPSFEAVAPGEDVRFINWTEGSVDITFAAGLFGQDTLTLTAGSKNTLTVQDQLPDGRYPYTARVGTIVVVGESSPEIIIDR